MYKLFGKLKEINIEKQTSSICYLLKIGTDRPIWRLNFCKKNSLSK